MKESIINIMLAAGCVVLTVVAGIGIYQKDRTAPLIRCDAEETFVYTEGESEEVLLDGMYAEDVRDGDVTESIRIEKIHITEKDQAVVVYTAKDQANNIGKFKRTVLYQEIEQQKEENSGVQKEISEQPQLRMTQNQVTLKIGDNFNLMRYVESATDSDGSDLSHNLHASGSYDMNSPGKYVIEVWALNEAGMKSNIEPFLLIVEE